MLLVPKKPILLNYAFFLTSFFLVCWTQKPLLSIHKGDLWKDLPFFAILVLSGLQFISGDIYEAAKVDGANGIQCFFRITLPLILKNVLTLTIPFTLWRLTTFDIVYSMTSGGPGEDTALIAYRITTEAFTNLNVGYASALAMLLFVVMAVFSWLNIHVMNKIDN